MIRLSANLSKKVPIIGQDFSSQQFGAALEIEVSDADKTDAIQARIKVLFDTLNCAVDDQIRTHGYGAESNAESAQTGTKTQTAQPSVSTRLPARGQSQNVQNTAQVASPKNNAAAQSSARKTRPQNNRSLTKATAAQVRAIFAISKSKNLDLTAVLADYNVASPDDLHVRDASNLIDVLKNGQSNGAH